MTPATDDPVTRLRALAEAVSTSYEADVFAYSGPLYAPFDNRVIAVCRELKPKRKNLLLILNTPGGSADAAYRIARCFQRCYRTDDADLTQRGQFLIYVHDECASAGTLLALGATGMIMSQKAQLGPIDVQLRRDDEVGERRSGLTTRQALETLSNEAASAFGRIFQHLRFHRSTQLPTKMAGEFAAEMACRVMEPIYAQIDPMKIGETERMVRISQEYGERLSTNNVKKQAISRLLSAYPSHEFVIDREEAGREIFNHIAKPSDELEELADTFVGNGAPADERGIFLNFISQPSTLTQEEADNAQTADPTHGADPEGKDQNGGEIRTADQPETGTEEPRTPSSDHQRGRTPGRKPRQNGSRHHHV